MARLRFKVTVRREITSTIEVEVAARTEQEALEQAEALAEVHGSEWDGWLEDDAPPCYDAIGAEEKKDA